MKRKEQAEFKLRLAGMRFGYYPDADGDDGFMEVRIRIPMSKERRAAIVEAEGRDLPIVFHGQQAADQLSLYIFAASGGVADPLDSK